MVSKEPSKCLLTASDSEVEPAASLALEMKYALDPNRQIKKRNKALQVRFKDICEAQNEQRDKQLSSSQDPDKREAKAISYKTAYRKYMTVPARRSIPNVTKSTGVQTSPDLKKCYQTFPLDRKKGNILKSASTVDTFKGQNNGFLIDAKDKDGGSSGDAGQWGRKGGSLQTAEFISHLNERINAESWRSSDLHSSPKESPPLPNSADPALEEPGRGKPAAGRPGSEEAAQPLHGRVFKTEVATVYLPSAGSHASQTDLLDLAAESDWSPCPAAEEDRKRTVHLNGVQAQAGDARACAARAQCQATECSEQTLQIDVSPMEENQPCRAAVAVSEECQQIVPHTEVVDLKAQLQMMENLISSSQETIKVLLGVIQELEKGEAHREGLSYRTGQDTANCDTCRNSACIIYSVELDFKQQEDKLQPVLRKLHPIEETQVAPLPYSQESYSSTPKQKSKTESKKHGRWKLWFL
ncbi:inhibitory synaptic factor 2A isoform X2 [Columba livia]|uniref:Family with sequence similarity 196, member A n=1 Tax=Columba livia TaxID=8932 RepID=A0A2I0MEE4_COLLI|nr:protein FAM196A [Columba livia]KAK2535816.1 Fam196a [Columba livia]PKK28055.1 family with sequence similarity 196, member A [Columba livia]